MSQPSFEQIALFQMLDRVESLERMIETLSASNAALCRRVDHLEWEARRHRRSGAKEQPG